MEEKIRQGMSHRELEWLGFSELVLEHVQDYTIPQYGDYPEDQATQFSEEECVKHIKRYCERYGKNARGPAEEERDIKKMAHYAAVLFYKRLARVIAEASQKTAP